MEDKILSFIKTNLIEDTVNMDLTVEEDLLSTGLIDSIGIMKLINFIEEEFTIKVPAEDMTIENFISVEAINLYLNSNK